VPRAETAGLGPWHMDISVLKKITSNTEAGFKDKTI
jgi:hypothetical protein